MPSDLLTALLGVLAGGAQGYERTSDKIAAEKRSAEEADKDRQIRRELLATEVGARAKEGEANRKLSEKELIQQRDLTMLKLQAEKDALEQDIKLKTRQLLDSNALDRVRIQASIDESKARLAQNAQELSLKSRGLDIEQAATLGTGKLGTGTPTKGAGAGNKDNPIQNLLGDVIKARISAAGSTGLLPETAAGDIQYVTELLKNPVIGAAFGLTQPPAPPPATGVGVAGSHAGTGGLGAAVSGNISPAATGILDSGLKGILNMSEMFAGPEGDRPLITRPSFIESQNANRKKKQSHLR